MQLIQNLALRIKKNTFSFFEMKYLQTGIFLFL